MWNLVVIPQASDMIPYSSSRRVAKYDGCQIQYWLSLPLWHYFAITYNWNHLKKLSNHHFNSDSCKKHVKFCFQDISKISPLSAFPSLIDTINLPHLGEKTCHCFHHTFDIGFYTATLKSSIFWAKCFFTCRNPPCIVPRTFTSGHISSGLSNCTNFGLDRVNRQTNQKNPTIIWGTWSLGAPTSGVLHALSGHPGRVTHTTQINLQSSSVGWTH